MFNAVRYLWDKFSPEEWKAGTGLLVGFDFRTTSVSFE